ncbi:MAG: glycosyltransferase family 4 protein [Phycisphaerae bacterium]
MRIVHLITRLILGGAQENTILSCEGLHDHGHEVYLLSGPTTGPEGSLVDRAASGGYTFEEIPHLIRAIHPLSDIRATLHLHRRFEALQPDVVHTHSSKAGILGRLAARRANVPHIVHTIHGMSFNRTQPRIIRRAYALAEALCAESCHSIVTVADAMTRQALAAGIGRPEQFTTIRSGMEVGNFDPAAHDGAGLRQMWGVADDEILIGTVARLFINKGYDQLIEIMDRAVRRSPRLRFVWVGDGADRPRYESELARRHLRDRVTLTGLVPPSEMPRILSAVDILAHTSQWEGLPRAAVQALLMEKPVVSFAIDGAPEVVIPGETGELAPLGDHTSFASAIDKLANDANLRSRYGQRGRMNCLESFDHRSMVEQLDCLYRRLSDG